ncbi:MAG: DUF5060 domain-containing protein [Bacteroidia bacterium]|nr:DUF5060 domain-containing protein [Bacteroidia bacterium]
MKVFRLLPLLFAGLWGLNTALSAPEILFLRASTDSVRLFEKFEVRMDIKADFVNPFDPDEIDLSAVFTAPSGKIWNIPGFYNYSDWRSLWMIRFSPDEVGVWNYVIHVRDRTGVMHKDSLSFVAVKSGHHGPVRVAANHRYLEYKDGTSFYGVGMWYNDSYSGYNSGRILPEDLDRLQRLGVNFISTFITPLETYASGMGRYDQNIAGRLDQVLEMCEERDMILSMNIWFHSYLSETVWGGGNIRWNTNPYQTITDARDFFHSKLAWYYQEKLYRYMIARWGYSRSLGIWFIVDEVNGTDGWVSGDTLGAAQWGKNVHDYFKAHDPWQHLTTGTRSGGIKEFWHEGYQTFDLAAREIYEAQGFAIIRDGKINPGDTHPLKDSYGNYAQEVRKLWHGYGRPAIIGETGWDHTFYEPRTPGYLAQYHNAIWVSMATGTAMMPFWWAYSGLLNDNIASSRLQSIREFSNEVPFSRLTDITPVDSVLCSGDGFAMKSKEMIYGWIVNPNTDVAGDEVTLSGIMDGSYKLRLFHTWRGRFLDQTEILTATGGKLVFSIPQPVITGSHANYIGQDIAFVLEKQ